MNEINHALIMAAGRGMRMMPITRKIPKAMAVLKGRTLIETGIKKLKKKIKNIHITVGYKGPILASHVVSRGVNTVFNTSGKGNCWWIFNTLLKNLDEPVLTLTCDNIVDIDLNFITDQYAKKNNPYCMLIPVRPNTKFSGDYIFHKNYNIKKISRTRPSDYYASGIQVINPKKINKVLKKIDNFDDLWSSLIRLNKIKCSEIYKKKWAAVDTKLELDYLNK